jgi:HD-GYP domain-containing protein (c-di-GMP phosphodiesterase class II)
MKTFSIFDLVETLAISMDLISPEIVDHHRRVTYISWHLAGELGLSGQEKADLVMAAMLHDCGALSLQNRLLTLQFEVKSSTGFSLLRHAETGYQLLKKLGHFAQVAEIVRYHHHPWQDSSLQAPENIPLSAYILHLADRFDVLTKNGSRVDILSHRDEILQEIKRKSGSLFKPDIVQALEHLAQKESFWLDIVNMSLSNNIGSYFGIGNEKLGYDNVLEMTEIFSHIIDFRSSFTAAHSSTVSVLSGSLARLARFSEEECFMMKIAGNLHDLGKLAMPLAILEKPGKLTGYEYNVIKSHTYYTFKVLSKFRGTGNIRRWAAYHHERVDGCGYPFRIKGAELDCGSRIVAVADVYTAVRENRPYRQEMSVQNATAILRGMAGKALDGDIVNLLLDNLPELEQIMFLTKEQSRKEYSALRPYL